MTQGITPESILGGGGSGLVEAMRAGLALLDSHSQTELLKLVGQRVGSLPALTPVDKSALQDSYGGAEAAPPDDLLVGRGMFYLTEQHRLCLDCTSGHYQMTWGYQPAALLAAAEQATAVAVVWDNHCNLPQTPVKLLAWLKSEGFPCR